MKSGWMRVAEHVEKAQGWGPSGDAWDSRFWIFEAWERRWRDEIISHELAQLTRVGSGLEAS